MLHSVLQFFQGLAVATSSVNSPKLFDPVSDSLISSTIVTMLKMMVDNMSKINNLTMHHTDSFTSMDIRHNSDSQGKQDTPKGEDKAAEDCCSSVGHGRLSVVCDDVVIVGHVCGLSSIIF